MYYCIYSHIFPDGSVYVGVTKQEKKYKRWDYGNGYTHQPEVAKQIAFWGWGCVKHEILEEGDMTKEEAYKKECDYTLKYVKEGRKVLNKYNTNNPCRYRAKEHEQEYEYVEITSGKVYDSLREAAKDIGISHETVRLSIKEGRPTKKGYQFEKRIKKIIIVLEGEEENVEQ